MGKILGVAVNVTKGMMVLSLGFGFASVIGALGAGIVFPFVLALSSMAVVNVIMISACIACGTMFLGFIGGGIFYKLSKSAKEAQNRDIKKNVCLDVSKETEKHIQR